MAAKIGAFKFAGNEKELICIKDIHGDSLRPGDEMILCFGEDPRTWDATVALADIPHNNGYCRVAVIDVNEVKGIHASNHTVILEIEKRKLFVPKIFFEEEKNGFTDL
ncbi:MAG: hypothetical protein AUJ34_01055 [Parcubacteria group bacterium CG1_02_41_12]|nr:MAG: hypothetical protein AUJ34_01055 [Parcubacteria group bacterium CG1_02_41_12]PIP66916.1 MAG: hypothetical protein COW93_03085 [Parcubacteria group bacterium CG22_combo_CG10-13_8_21_14_all_41_9]PIQ78007.1 MAG: hypothetical protein COV79_05685 [Parcubacteria group bacterium CG11_big_fil_rev_8_21_14_0_20_41_14]PIR56674.1 MAG: hypothetical protein COU72_05025 [Parcubacteria group bacterium CG10_big_fil_rev_8_21_14_0_10_41_35]